MRNIFLIILLSAFLFSCDSKPSQAQANKAQTLPKDGYTITGKVKYPRPGKIVLSKLQNNGFQPVDSIKLDKNNTFTLKGKVNEPGFYMLDVLETQKVLLILENTNIEVLVDGNSPTGAVSVKGSKDNEDLQKINKIQAELQERANELGAKFQEANLKKDEKAKEAIQKKFMQFESETKERIKAEIRQIGPSLASLYATNMLNPEEDYPFLDSLSKQLQQKMPNSKYAKDFAAQIAQFKNVISIGQQAPEITLSNPEGKQVSLSSLKGKYVLIDFWASWCGPCRQENPNVVKMYNKHKGKNFEIFGVSLDKDKEKWVSAIQQDGLSWVHVSDLKFWQSAAAEKYGVRSIPATFLVDPSGKIIAKNLRGQALEEKLAQVLTK